MITINFSINEKQSYLTWKLDCCDSFNLLKQPNASLWSFADGVDAKSAYKAILKKRSAAATL